jgi:hypothetical protein
LIECNASRTWKFEATLGSVGDSTVALSSKDCIADSSGKPARLLSCKLNQIFRTAMHCQELTRMSLSFRTAIASNSSDGPNESPVQSLSIRLETS